MKTRKWLSQALLLGLMLVVIATTGETLMAAPLRGAAVTGVWSVVPGAPEGLTAIAATSSGEVWVADGSNIYRQVDDGWVGVSTTYSGSSQLKFNALAASGSDNVWASGSFILPNRVEEAPAVARWNGQAFQVFCDTGACYNSARADIFTWWASAIWAYGATNAFAVGATVTGVRSGNPVLGGCNTDGCGYSFPSNSSGAYTAIAGVSNRDLWVGGATYEYNKTFGTLLEHWNGRAMAHPAVPDLGKVLDIAAPARDDVWAVAERGILHWDGTAWSQVPSPAMARGIAARTWDDAWAVGDVIQHWDGQAWTIVDAPAVSLNDITIVGRDIWAAGSAVLHYSDPTQFIDVPVGSTFYPYVHCVAGVGAIGGYADGNFRPLANMTRGQVAKLIANVAGFSETYSSARFSDVGTDNPFFQYIERLAQRGIIGGYADGSFRPNAVVTRAQLAKIISNAAGLADQYSEASFSDVPVGSPFFQFIERLVHHGIIGGYADGTFRPANSVTRGQAAKFAANTYLPSCAAGPSK